MIEVKEVIRAYGDFKAVNNVSFEIKRGEVVGLLGHNGAGKTTIMKMITGFLEPTSGNIRVGDLELGKDTRAIQKKIGYLPENCPLWPEMTVIDYLDYQAGLHDIPKTQRQAAVARSIRRAALTGKASQPIQTLSRGYRQRVGVAQAILHDPDIIILDEPTNGLDPTQIKQMRSLIHELAESATVIISTHILQEVQAVCERVLILNAGRLAVDARLDELQAASKLLVAVGNDKADAYLSKVAGVESVSRSDDLHDYPCFALQTDIQHAPKVAAAVQQAGDQLYSLQFAQRNLETVFAEVNEDRQMDQEEAA